MFRILITLLLWKTFDAFVEFWIYLIEKCNHGSQKVRTDQITDSCTIGPVPNYFCISDSCTIELVPNRFCRTDSCTIGMVSIKHSTILHGSDSARPIRNGPIVHENNRAPYRLDTARFSTGSIVHE